MNTSRKKLLICANSAWNFNHFRRPLIRALREKYEVILVAPEAHNIEEEGIQKISLFSFSAGGKSLWKEGRSRRELIRAIRKVAPDTCLFITVKPILYATRWCRKNGIRTMVLLTGLGQIFLSNGWAMRWARRYLIHSLKSAHVVVVQNYDDAHFLSAFLTHPPKVVPGSGVDTQYFRLNGDPPRFDFLFLGRCMKEKGMAELMAAVEILTQGGVPFALKIAGTYETGDSRYPPRADWDRFLASPHVEYLGQVADVRTVLSQVRSLVLPSWREGLSRSILEAMSMERVVITNDVPGCRGMIVHGVNGFLAEKGDVDSLVGQMLAVLKMSAKEGFEMGSRARQWVLENADVHVITPQYVALVDQLLSDE